MSRPGTVIRTPALAVVIALAATASVAGCGDETPQVTGAATGELLEGIPQANVSLGSETAEAVATVYADPFCAGEGCAALEDVVERAVQSHVRPGRLRLVMRPVSTPGYPSFDLPEIALAAGMQDRLWNYMMTFWENQEVVTDPFRIAGAVEGLDVERLRADAESERVVAAADRAASRAEARDAEVPSLYFDPPGRGAADVEEIPLDDPVAASRTLNTLLAADDPG